MKQSLVSIFLILIFLSSCQEPAVFREYRKMANVSWNRFNILEFEVLVEKGDLLDFDILLRHHTDFPYDKLYVNITFYTPGGDMRSAEYDFKLKNENGKWLANGMGDLWDIELPIRKEMHFYEAGICKVRIENKYPKVNTPGIIEVGLLVKKSGDWLMI